MLRVTCLGGIVFLLYTFWNIRTGEADFFAWMGEPGIEVTREDNGIFFWIAIVLQMLVSLGMIVLGGLLHQLMG